VPSNTLRITLHVYPPSLLIELPSRSAILESLLSPPPLRSFHIFISLLSLALFAIILLSPPRDRLSSAIMRTSRFQSLAGTLSFSNIRTSLRRSSSTSNHSTMSSNRDSYASSSNSSPIDTINAIMHRQPSMLEMDEERRSVGSALEIMEPRPIVYWGGLEERMGSL